MRTTAVIEINGPMESTKFQRQRKLVSLMAALGWSVMALLAANLSEAADDSVFKTKDVILVHGAWADGSSWSKVIPLLERKGFHVTAVQLPLTSVTDDVATLQRAIEFEPGPLLLVGHSYAGVVISEAGNDPKVSGLVYIAAYAPDAGQSVVSLNALVPETPITLEFSLNEGFLSLTNEGIRTDFAPDLPDTEQQTLAVTQGPIAEVAFGTPATAPAWRTKPSWYMVAKEDRVISPRLEAMMAQTINAETTTVHSSHVIMLSRPEAVADFITRAAQGRD
jgi:pimeloyl-ACP methyl ester carboxylesterase